MAPLKSESRGVAKSLYWRRPACLDQLIKLAAMPSLLLLLATEMQGQCAVDCFDSGAEKGIADQRCGGRRNQGDSIFTKLGGGGTWSATGSLAVARYAHTATLLASAKVLVAGGSPGSSPPTSAELYDPANGTWSGTGSLLAPRREHTALLLPSGRVLVAGGSGTNFNPVATAELYDPVSGTWSATGSFTTARYGHTMTLLPNGKVLIAGGQFSSSTVFGSAEVYDPASGTWTGTGSLAAARYGHTATLLPNGKVLIAGGYNDATGGYVAIAELYDPASGAWSATGGLATRRVAHTATLLPNGKVLVAGGSGISGYLASVELYDPASGTWSSTGSLAIGRRDHATTLLPTGKVLVAGGFVPGGTTASSELYDPPSGTWNPTGSLVPGRFLHTLTLQSNGTVLIAGGSIGNDGGPGLPPLAQADLYDIGPIPAPSTLANISTRLPVETGDNVLIGGFIVTGTQPKKVIVGHWTSLQSRSPGDPVHELRILGALLCFNTTGETTPTSRKPKSSRQPFRQATIWNQPSSQFCLPTIPPTPRSCAG